MKIDRGAEVDVMPICDFNQANDRNKESILALKSWAWWKCSSCLLMLYNIM